MRPSFERIVGGYNEIAKDKLDAALTNDEELDLDSELRSRIRRAAQERASNPRAQERVYQLQERKQEIMAKLKEHIALLDEPEYVPERRDYEKKVVQDGEQLYVEDAKGFEPVTRGEVVTDMEWGGYYYLDPETVDRNIRKRYLIEDAKHDLQRLLNEQITIDETSSENVSEGTRGAYERKAESDGMEPGEIAELMVRNFLKKIAIDFDASFDIIEADAHLDITKKVDFIVRRKAHHRGVGVEESENEAVGVQFTMSSDADRLKHKAEQLERSRQLLKPSDHLDDVILVSVPGRFFREAYQGWKTNQRPGGPDKLLAPDIKEQIFREVMKGILTPDEIDAEWGKVVGTIGLAA